MMRTISKDEYLEVGQKFHWASKEHYQIWFTGSTQRHGRTEQMLPRLVRKGKLVAIQYSKKLIYAVPSKKNLPIEHGLGCTEGLVRICRSNLGGTIIQERFFRGFGSVPEWGIRYDNRLLLYEFSTQNNFEHARVMKTKITKYEENLPKIISKFKVEKAVVLFVLDISRERVKNFLQREQPIGPYLFTDYETFTSVPIGQQLEANIYMWGDGKTYPLKK